MDEINTQRLILAVAVPFPLGHVVLGLANLDALTTIWPTLAAMLVCVALVAFLARPCPTGRMPVPSAIAVIAGTTLMTVLVQWGLPHGIHPGYAAWHTGALQMLLVALVFRHQIALAWVGAGAFVVAQSIGAELHAMTRLDSIVMMATPVGWVSIATLVNAMLKRSAREIKHSAAIQHRAETRLASVFAEQVARGQWAVDLDQRTRPALERILDAKLSEADLQEFMLLEAELRDAIRGRALALRGVAEAARGARSRGVRVELLDDLRIPLAPSIESEAANQLIAVLRRSQGGFVTARAYAESEDQLVRIVAFDERSPDSELAVQIGTNKN